MIRKKPFVLSILGLLLFLLSVLNLAQPQDDRPFVVNTSDDLDDGICDDIHCSLREAINAANSREGADLIIFDPAVFPLSGDVAIAPSNEHFPHLLDDRTTIDATGTSVTIDGSNYILLEMKEPGLIIKSSGNRIRGIKFTNIPYAPIAIMAVKGRKANDNFLIDISVSDSVEDALSIQADGINSIASRNIIMNCTAVNNEDDGINVVSSNGGVCSQNIVYGNFISDHPECGVEVESSSGGQTCFTIVADNIIRGHTYPGSLVIYSEGGGKVDDSIVCSNVVTSGLDKGISVAACETGSEAMNNIVMNNVIKEHLKDGISISCAGANCSKNVIKGNKTQDNDGYGIYLDADDNHIYHNNIGNNGFQGSDNGNNNRWDKKGEGNYWNDYSGIDNDGDGLGDSPYIISPNGVDRFPLMKKFLQRKPNSPNKLKAFILSNQGIKLRWNDKSKNEDGFEIHRKEKIGKKWIWLLIWLTKANVKTYKDTNLIPNTIYKYRVRAFNAGGYSRYSNIIKVKTE